MRGVDLTRVLVGSLSATPASQSVVQGAGTTYAVSITPSGGFTAAVTLSVSGLPGGVTASFSPNPATALDRKSTRLNSSHVRSSYAVFFSRENRTLTRPPS